MQISDLAKTYPASGTRKMFDLAAKYKDVIGLTLGDPNFDTPQYIKDAAVKYMMANETHYVDNMGLMALREAIAEKYNREFGYSYSYENVFIGCGAIQVLNIAVMNIVNMGDEVLITDPVYPNYRGIIHSLHAKAVHVPVYEKDEFKITHEEMVKRITPKTKLLILNSPCNPLGSILTKDDLMPLIDPLVQNNIAVISDEIYDKIIFDGHEHFSIAQIDEIHNNVIVLNGFSKTYAMTGWRVGYALAHKDFMKYIPGMQEGMVSCLPGFIQYACIDALNGAQDSVVNMVNTYRERRDIVVSGLNSIQGITCFKSPGSFYAFVNIKELGLSSEEFALQLLERVQVAVTPGSAFGDNGEGYIRISFANSDENLYKAIERIKAFAESL